MSTIKIYSPEGLADDAAGITPITRAKPLSGLRIAVLDNGKSGANTLLEGMASGLVEARQVLAHVNGIAFTDFTAADVVRHPLVARIVEAYESQPPRDPRPPSSGESRSGAGDAASRRHRPR